jgi:hypothetical protein
LNESALRNLTDNELATVLSTNKSVLVISEVCNRFLDTVDRIQVAIDNASEEAYSEGIEYQKDEPCEQCLELKERIK